MVKYILYPNGVSLKYETDSEEGEEILDELEESLGIPIPDTVAIVDGEYIDKVAWDAKSRKWIPSEVEEEESPKEDNSEDIPKLDNLPQLYYVWDSVTNKSSVMDIINLLKYGSVNADHELKITKL